MFRHEVERLKSLLEAKRDPHEMLPVEDRVHHEYGVFRRYAVDGCLQSLEQYAVIWLWLLDHSHDIEVAKPLAGGRSRVQLPVIPDADTGVAKKPRPPAHTKYNRIFALGDRL